MKGASLAEFELFLREFTKKNGRKLGEKTIPAVLTLAKYIEETPPGGSIAFLRKLHGPYLRERNNAVANYSLWLYLHSKKYAERTIKDIVSFKRRSNSAITDEEKLAQSVLSKKELYYLVENIKNPRDNLIIRFLYDTGARVSEMTNLKLKDVDLNTGEVQLMGKGRKPRTVFFQQRTAELLKEHIVARSINAPNDLLFKLKPVSVWYNLKKYGKELLQRDLHPHMLRHSRLQHMADEGVDSFAIKSYAGHSDIGTTQIYIKNSKFQRKLAFDKAGNIWLDRK